MTQRILIICPEPAKIESLGRVLRAAGFEVLYAKAGARDLPQLCDRHVDLLVLDLDWPKDRAWETAEVFGRFYLLPPVIGITSRPGQFEHAAALGVDFLLEKPLNYAHLLGTIYTLLNQFARERRMDRLVPWMGSPLSGAGRPHRPTKQAVASPW